ncbi:GDSL-type esterase/lipase family protein [Elizabethkingia sp. JS20170427COW]|uniref:GDSL-type esterase/lipase family protein n=1 Tax=Elizabethkingia sp. JS20170427COW TaxID=2583851 RepID=UPI00110FFDA5|nr:GDSL-type esterase/lipase family protein [Elizabethkingia sp. JS20170427COW]QCX54268.1 sialate O-acetylesterase [Elizabethkingia sp. JS20170427COW]
MIRRLLPSLLFLLCWVQFSFAQSRKIKVACVGNSITYGFGAKNPAEESYPARLQGLLGTSYEVKNFGHSGATLIREAYRPYHKTKEYQAALQYQADIAIIELGVNDTDPRDWPHYRDSFERDYHLLIQDLKRSNPKVEIYITRLLPVFEDHPRFQTSTYAWYWDIQKKLESIAKGNKVRLIDTYTPFAKRPDLIDDWNTLHPNAKGYAHLSQMIYKSLTGNYGGLKMPMVFTDHMVIQRGLPFPVWGTANSGDKITVSFRGESLSTTVGEDGKWTLRFPGMKADATPQSLHISNGEQSLVYRDILIGDVWFAAGQSNMYFSMKETKDSQQAIGQADLNAPLRLFKFKPIAETNNVAWDQKILDQTNELDFFTGSWQKNTPDNVKDFSAVAYTFGKKIQQEKGVPIGIIELAVGGSPQIAWMDRQVLQQDPLFVNALKSNWRSSDFMMEWCRGRADKNLEKTSYKQQRHPYQPSYIYDAGVSHLIQFPIKGMIWYQGESDTENAELYSKEFPLFVSHLRKQWGYNFPFYYVQLSGLNRPSWPFFRNTQRELAHIVENSGMVVTSDLGDRQDVHYRNKQPVGLRLANTVLHHTYHKKGIIPSGPDFISAQEKTDYIELSFNYSKGLASTDGKELRGFQVVNQLGIFAPTKAYIKNRKILIPRLKNDTITRIVYAWEGYPDANLTNSSGLPTGTFSVNITPNNP